MFALLFMPLSSMAQTEAKPPPLLEADTISFDENTNIVTATGHVEVGLSDKILRADKVTYNKTTDVVLAKGNVALTEASGEILYSDQMELTSDMKQGLIEKIGVLFPDNSRLVANDAQRYEGRYLIAKEGIYSSCNLCAKDPKAPPLWQLKGKRITHDTEAKNVIYRDATLEFAGLPVFYTPYFSHPDPTVKRRQGFLTPSGGVKNILGTMARTPYYFDIAPNNDLLVTPTFSTVDKLQLETAWRYRFMNGEMKWTGSLTQADFVDETGDDRGQRLRGHLFGTAQFDLTDTWRAGTKIAITTDKSYLPRYSISAEDTLVNQAYLENFKGRNYAVANTYYFQDLRPGDQLVEPIVAPEIRYSAFGEPNKMLGGRWSFNSSLLVTSREKDVDITKQGPSTRRLSVDTGWERQIISNTGFLTTVSGILRADGYWADNVPDPNLALGSSFTDVSRIRPFAQADLSVRYPMGRHGRAYQQIIEPIAVLSVAPRVSNRHILPNEDSIDTEFDETNLFSANRFTGLDRVEGGTRTAYGLRHAIIGDNGGRIEMVGGQVFRLNQDNTFAEGSGLTRKLSDYVGRVDLIPSNLFEANYGFRLDQHDLAFTKQEFQTSIGPQIFRPYASYLFVEQYNSSTLMNEKLEEATLGFTSRFAKYWTFSIGQTQAFKPSPGPRAMNANLLYQDECFTTGVTAKRDYTSRLDISAGSSIMFQFYLKNIGGLSTD
ncbi:MAG: LPS assembly protein LptD [Alphaproteobacteria bacterium]|nr:LPS assembly protein LptD [Alphaproteobacteria bacterium]